MDDRKISAPASPRQWYQKQAAFYESQRGRSGTRYEALLAKHFMDLCALLDRLGCESLEDVEALTRIEPLHATECPYKPYEDTYDAPEGIKCSCSDALMAHRWKARAVLARAESRKIGAERDALRSALREIAAMKTCDDPGEADRCEGDSGPYCSEHVSWDLRHVVKKTRALLGETDRP